MDNLLFFVAEPLPEGVRVENNQKCHNSKYDFHDYEVFEEKNSTNMNYFILGNGVSQKVPYF